MNDEKNTTEAEAEPSTRSVLGAWDSALALTVVTSFLYVAGSQHYDEYFAYFGLRPGSALVEFPNILMSAFFSTISGVGIIAWIWYLGFTEERPAKPGEYWSLRMGRGSLLAFYTFAAYPLLRLIIETFAHRTFWSLGLQGVLVGIVLFPFVLLVLWALKRFFGRGPGARPAADQIEREMGGTLPHLAVILWLLGLVLVCGSEGRARATRLWASSPQSIQVGSSAARSGVLVYSDENVHIVAWKEKDQEEVDEVSVISAGSSISIGSLP